MASLLLLENGSKKEMRLNLDFRTFDFKLPLQERLHQRRATGRFRPFITRKPEELGSEVDIRNIG